MGGAVSSGSDNDDLINNLVKANYIKTPLIERVFRAVDRSFYFLPNCRQTAYKDIAWKHGNIHISAPCIYSEVMENLKLEPGNSFLNLGSGTGYFSTMAGLLLGLNGINHGIEIHQEVIDYAYLKLAEFKKTCDAIDSFQFCEPVFVQGNSFSIKNMRQYDRVYCGAACPEIHQSYMKNLIKVGGILIMPCNEELLRITRKSETEWETESVLPVSFSTLQLPDKKNAKSFDLPDTEPRSLSEICRSQIRKIFREITEKEHPKLTETTASVLTNGTRSRISRHRRCLVFNDARFAQLHQNNGVPPVRRHPSLRADLVESIIFEDYRMTSISSVLRRWVSLGDNNSDDNDIESDDDSDESGNIGGNRSISNEGSSMSNSLVNEETNVENVNDMKDNKELNKEIDESDVKEQNQDVTENGKAKCSEQDNTDKSHSDDAKMVLTENQLITGSSNSSIESTRTCNTNNRIRIPKNRGRIEIVEMTDPEVLLTEQQKSPKKNFEETGLDDTNNNAKKFKNNDTTEMLHLDESEKQTVTEKPQKIVKREKLDSGIGDESENTSCEESENVSCEESGNISCEESENICCGNREITGTESDESMDIDCDDSDSMEDSIYSNSSAFSNDIEKSTDLSNKQADQSTSPKITYRVVMQEKIMLLPLPVPLKSYLNYNRDF